MTSIEKTSKPKFTLRFEEMLGFDLRSLALFRMGLAVIILADLIIRTGDLQAHYTDAGVLPRTVLMTKNYPSFLLVVSFNERSSFNPRNIICFRGIIRISSVSRLSH